MQFKAKEFDFVVNKLKMEDKDTHHKIVWFIHDGKRILKTRRSQGSGDVPACNLIRQQLKVNEEQMRGLISCSFSLQNYIDLLKEKKVIEEIQKSTNQTTNQTPKPKN
jgi:hypothetical protein